MGINTVSASLDLLNTQLGGAEGTIPATATKVEALREIYTTLGGADDVSHISTVSEMVEKVAEVAEGGGGLEPAPGGLKFKNNNAYSVYLWYTKRDGEPSGAVEIPNGDTKTIDDIMGWRGNAKNSTSVFAVMAVTKYNGMSHERYADSVSIANGAMSAYMVHGSGTYDDTILRVGGAPSTLNANQLITFSA